MFELHIAIISLLIAAISLLYTIEDTMIFFRNSKIFDKCRRNQFIIWPTITVNTIEVFNDGGTR